MPLAAQYNIYRSLSPDSGFTYIGTTFCTAAKPTQYVDQDLTEGTTYYYKLISVIKNGYATLVSGKSEAAGFTVQPSPAAP